jgi:16S rRNA processing protein RimM
LSIEEHHLRIAKITGAHGLHGRLKIFIISDLLERFSEGSRVFLRKGDSFSGYTINEFRPQKGRTALLGLDGVADRDSALGLKGMEVFIRKEEAERSRERLDENSFYYFDLIGCDVYMEGSLFGQVESILEAGAGDILVIRDAGGREVLLPFVGSMVDTRDVRSKKIVITPVEGLLE